MEYGPGSSVEMVNFKYQGKNGNLNKNRNGKTAPQEGEVDLKTAGNNDKNPTREEKKHLLPEGGKKEKSKIRAPSNWAKLIGTLKDDLSSSDETAPRRRRAYTEMDDLLNNDIL